MERLTIAQCRKLIGQPETESLADEAVIQLRDMLYSLADVIADAFIDLENVDQTLFAPAGDVVDIFEMRVRELNESMTKRETQ
jgi:hypothetical protein